MFTTHFLSPCPSGSQPTQVTRHNLFILCFRNHICTCLNFLNFFYFFLLSKHLSHSTCITEISVTVLQHQHIQKTQSEVGSFHHILTSQEFSRMSAPEQLTKQIFLSYIPATSCCSLSDKAGLYSRQTGTHTHACASRSVQLG